MEIFNVFYGDGNVFYGDGNESKEYIGSSFTLDGAIEIIKKYWKYQPYEDGDNDNPKWIEVKDYYYPILKKFKNPEYSDYFKVEIYNIEEVI